MAINKRSRGDELGAIEKQPALGTSGFQVRRPNHSATISPRDSYILACAHSLYYLHTTANNELHFQHATLKKAALPKSR